MCGIAGIAFRDPARPARQPMLTRMTAILRHRGPDGDGYHLAPGIGLGMRRLSVIDTVTGDQPMTNESGSVVLVCNGEIYNYVELRERLLAKGHQLRTRSDVEVIAHLYEDDPDGFLRELRGMFAFALWDARRRRLLLVRDRLGIKPLHYALTADGLVFGSELKAVLASGAVTPTRDGRALRELFALGFVRAPRTMVSEIRRLPPGHWLAFASGTVTTGCYWDVVFPARHAYDRTVRMDAWAASLRDGLSEAVRVHLRSDVPVGAWLSSGIDSSAVAALASRELKQPLPTFSLGFDDPRVDETKHRRLLDEIPDYHLAGHRRQCGGAHAELLGKAVWHREQPFALGVEIPRLLLSELAAKHVKVVLAGEGADELLGGYPWYGAERVLSLLASWPAPARAAVARLLAGRWPGAARILSGSQQLDLERFQALIGSLGQQWPPELLALDDGEPEELALPDAFASWHPFAQLQYFDIKLRLADLIIPHVDLPSMAHSLEVRVPFLDHVLVELCSAIPPWVKMRGLREKHVLRRAMQGILPPEICWRGKFGLSAPTGDWLAAAPLSQADLRAQGCFDPATVARLLAQHRRGRANHGRLLMLIATTVLWEGQFLSLPRSAEETT
jgi:asparagine synthase (glutamine-hydrolysing)